jgi:hypothetical protein
VIKSIGDGIVTCMDSRILKIRPVESSRKKTMISLHHFFFKRGGISNREIIAPINKIPRIDHIDDYSSISF